MTKVRMLTDTGLERTQEFFRLLKEDSSCDVPESLLSGEDCTEPVGDGTVELDTSRIFDDRHAFGRYLTGALSETVEAERLNRHSGFWTWICLSYFDQICPKDSGGRRSVREISRYVLSKSAQRYYRHAVWTPYTVVRVHGENARTFLSVKLDVHGEAAEQFLSRQQLFENRELFAAMNRLYLDTAGSFKSGARGSGGGSLRRLGKVLRQYALTYDVTSMTSTAIDTLLPKEFERFRSAKAE